MKSFPLQVVVVSQFLSTQLSLHVDGKETFLTLIFFSLDQCPVVLTADNWLLGVMKTCAFGNQKLEICSTNSPPQKVNKY